MGEMAPELRSTAVFGVPNLGRAIIELLVSGGWTVTAVALSRSPWTSYSEWAV